MAICFNSLMKARPETFCCVQYLFRYWSVKFVNILCFFYICEQSIYTVNIFFVTDLSNKILDKLYNYYGVLDIQKYSTNVPNHKKLQMHKIFTNSHL